MIKKNLRNLKKCKKGVKKLEETLNDSRQRSSMRLYNDDFRFFKEMWPEKTRLSKSSPVKLRRKSRNRSSKRLANTDGKYLQKKRKYRNSSSKLRRSLRKSSTLKRVKKRKRAFSNDDMKSGILPIQLENKKKDVGDYILMPSGVYQNLVNYF